ARWNRWPVFRIARYPLAERGYPRYASLSSFLLIAFPAECRCTFQSFSVEYPMTDVMTGDEQIALRVVALAPVPVLALLLSVRANRLVQVLGLERLRRVLRPLLRAQVAPLAIHLVSLVSCSCLQKPSLAFVLPRRLEVPLQLIAPASWLQSP